jgi:hypothetical protein
MFVPGVKDPLPFLKPDMDKSSDSDAASGGEPKR